MSTQTEPTQPEIIEDAEELAVINEFRAERKNRKLIDELLNDTNKVSTKNAQMMLSRIKVTFPELLKEHAQSLFPAQANGKTKGGTLQLTQEQKDKVDAYYQEHGKLDGIHEDTGVHHKTAEKYLRNAGFMNPTKA